MTCCQNGPYNCNLCYKEKCIDCVHILIDTPPHSIKKGCYCETCMQTHNTIWVSCFGCNDRIYLVDKSKYTLLDLYLKCDECP